MYYIVHFWWKISAYLRLYGLSTIKCIHIFEDFSNCMTPGPGLDRPPFPFQKSRQKNRPHTETFGCSTEGSKRKMHKTAPGCTIMLSAGAGPPIVWDCRAFQSKRSAFKFGDDVQRCFRVNIGLKKWRPILIKKVRSIKNWIFAAKITKKTHKKSPK